MTVSARRKQLFVAMSYWSATNGMGNTTTAAGAPNTADIGGSQDINVAAAPCGCVYYLQMDNTWNANSMAPLVCGTSQSADTNGNTCAVNNIANPDNINIMEDFDTLLIGEDTSLHRVDYIWQARSPLLNARQDARASEALRAALTLQRGALCFACTHAQYTFPNAPGVGSPANGTLTPIFSGTLGAEVTSAYWCVNRGQNEANAAVCMCFHPRSSLTATPAPLRAVACPCVRHNLGNGNGVIFNVIQHPYGESDNGFATLPTSSGTQGYIGYVGPIPIPPATQV